MLFIARAYPLNIPKNTSSKKPTQKQKTIKIICSKIPNFLSNIIKSSFNYIKIVSKLTLNYLLKKM